MADDKYMPRARDSPTFFWESLRAGKFMGVIKPLKVDGGGGGGGGIRRRVHGAGRPPGAWGEGVGGDNMLILLT